MTAETTPPFGVAQKPWMWAPLVCAGPLTTSRRRLWVSGLLPPGNCGPCTRAATLKPTKQRRELLHNSRAGNPKRKRQNCHNKEVVSNQREQVDEEPRSLASRRHRPLRTSEVHRCHRVIILVAGPQESRLPLAESSMRRLQLFTQSGAHCLYSGTSRLHRSFAS